MRLIRQFTMLMVLFLTAINGHCLEIKKITNSTNVQLDDWTKTSDKNGFRLKMRVGTKTYTNFRKWINLERLPRQIDLKLEEWLNVFYYDFDSPSKTDFHPVKITTEIAPCPWSVEDDLVMLKLKGREAEELKHIPVNFVFLLDVSASMKGESRIMFFKKYLQEFTKQLGKEDQISIVTYKDNPSVYLEPTLGIEKEEIVDQINRLKIGSIVSDRSKGIKTAYKLIDGANPHHNNRIIVVSDGDWGVGISSEKKLLEFIDEKHEEGIKLSVLGYDLSNEYDSLMIKMATNGRGNYAYVNNEKAAKSIFKTEFMDANYIIAKNVNLTIEFDPSIVHSYRLFGYQEGRLLDGQYRSNYFVGDDLTREQELIAFYQVKRKKGIQGDLGILKFEYSAIDTDSVITIVDTLKNGMESSEDFNFGSCVIQYVENILLGKNRGRTNVLSAIKVAKQNLGTNSASLSFQKRKEFIDLMEASLMFK